MTPWTAACQASLPIVNSQSLLKLILSQWCHPTVSSVIPFCLQSFPESGSFPVSQLFTSGGQSIEASASVLPLNILDWFPLGLTGLITLLSKGLSRVFSSTTVQKHQWSNLACLSSYSTICSWSCLFQPYGTSLCPPYSPCSSPSTFTHLSSYLLFILRI